jgi:hypothetical protein
MIATPVARKRGRRTESGVQADFAFGRIEAARCGVVFAKDWEEENKGA